MEQSLIDTNIISDYLSASLSTAGIKFMDGVIDTTPNLSVITQIELLCWKTNDLTEQKVRDFIADSLVLTISPDVIALCIDIRRSAKIKTPDAIISATALARGYTLITNNEKDFLKIKGLKVVNPKKL